MTYAEAQMMIDDTSRQDAVTVSLRHLNRLAKILKKQRIQNGYAYLKKFFLKRYVVLAIVYDECWTFSNLIYIA